MHGFTRAGLRQVTTVLTRTLIAMQLKPRPGAREFRWGTVVGFSTYALRHEVRWCQVTKERVEERNETSEDPPYRWKVHGHVPGSEKIFLSQLYVDSFAVEGPRGHRYLQCDALNRDPLGDAIESASL